jgi:RHS repeat-associated protein
MTTAGRERHDRPIDEIILGVSPPIRRLRRLIERVASAAIPVVIGRGNGRPLRSNRRAANESTGVRYDTTTRSANLEPLNPNPFLTMSRGSRKEPQPLWRGSTFAALMLAGMAAPASAFETSRGNLHLAPPTATFAPASGSVVGSTVTVTITWCATSGSLNLSSHKVLLNGSNITTQFSTNTTSVFGCTSAVRSIGTITLFAGSNSLVSMITDGTGALRQSVATYSSGPNLSLAEQQQRGLIDPARCIADCFEATLAYSTPAYVSRDVPRTAILQYRSGRAFPTAAVQVEATDAAAAAGTLFRLKLRRTWDNAFQAFTNNALELTFARKTAGSTILAAQVHTGGLATGAYRYKALVTSIYPNNVVSAEASIDVMILVVNEAASPLGAGVAVADLQRAKAQSDGVLVWDGDGEASFFSGTCALTASCSYTAPVGDWSWLSTDGTGYYKRTYPDGTVRRFNSLGLQETKTDRFGNQTSYAYVWNAAYGTYTIDRVTDPAGKQITFAYVPNPSSDWRKAGSLASITSLGGRQATFGVDANNDLRHWRDVDLSYAYMVEYEGTSHRVRAVTDRNGGTWEYTYGYGSAAPTKVLAPAISINGQPGQRPEHLLSEPMGLIYAAQRAGAGTIGNPIQTSIDARAFTKSARGFTTFYTTNRFGSATKTESPLGAPAFDTYDAFGRLMRSQSASGKVVKMTYNSSRLESVYDSSAGKTISYEYETGYDLVKSVSTNGVLERCYRYDKAVAGWPMLQAFGASSGYCQAFSTIGVYSYTPDGRAKTFAGPGGQTTWEYETTGLQNQLSETIEGQGTTSYGHDQFGRVVSVTNSKGVSNTVDFDALNRVRWTVGAAADTTRLSYDGKGNLVMVVDAKGQVLEFRRNALGWVEAEIDATPSHRQRTFVYDSDGNILVATNRRGQVVRMAYDEMQRIRSRVLESEGGALTTYWYSPDGRLVVSQSGESLDSVFYDASGQVTSEVTVRSGLGRRGMQVTSFGPERHTLCLFDAVGACVPTSAVHRTATGSVSGISNPASGGSSAHLRVDESGYPEELAGLVPLTRNIFGATRETETSSFALAAHTEMFGRTDTLDARIAAVTKRAWESGELQQFGYDSSDRLSSWFTDAGDVSRSGVPRYDVTGNRIDRSASLNDPANRLTAFDGMSLAYDDDGQVVTLTRGGVTDSFEWNSLGQLSTVRRAGVVIATFGYDGFGRRVRKTSSSTGITHYLWDDTRLVAEYDGTGAHKTTYTFYPGVDLLHSITTGGQTYYTVLERPGGDVIGLVRWTDDTIVGRYAYLPWGELVLDIPGVANSVLWHGMLLDRETGLYYARSRYYEPRLGRFLSEDPIGIHGGVNQYVFADNDPVNHRDPNGLFGCEDQIIMSIPADVYYNDPDEARAYAFKVCSAERTLTILAQADPLYFFGGALALFPGYGMSAGLGRYQYGHRAGLYITIGGGAGADVSVGGEGGKATSRQAFKGVTDEFCGGLGPVGLCRGGNSSGRVTSGSVMFGTREFPTVLSSHVARTYTWTIFEAPVFTGCYGAALKHGRC